MSAALVQKVSVICDGCFAYSRRKDASLLLQFCRVWAFSDSGSWRFLSRFAVPPLQHAHFVCFVALCVAASPAAFSLRIFAI